MTREDLLKHTIDTLTKLPESKMNEVADFADFILKKYDEEILQQGIQKLVSDSKTYDFLKEEEDIYTVKDLIER